MRLGACCVAVGVALTSRNAFAEPPSSLRVAGDAEACPSPAQLIKQLHALLPHTKLRAATEASSSDDAVITDEGTKFSVKVAGQSREFTDEHRQCSDRARLGAVFVALVLDPLKFPEEKPPDSGASNADSGDAPPGESAESKKPPPPQPKPKPEDRREPQIEYEAPQIGGLEWSKPELDFELGPAIQLAPDADSTNTPVLGGVGARLRWGNVLSLSLGAGAFLPTTLSYDDGSARVILIPADISGRIRTRWGDWEAAMELGPTATWLRVQGQNVADAQSASRLDVGIRAGAVGRYWAGRSNALFLGLHGALFPRPYALQLEGLGKLGETPTVWVGASIGVVIKAY